MPATWQAILAAIVGTVIRCWPVAMPMVRSDNAPRAVADDDRWMGEQVVRRRRPLQAGQRVHRRDTERERQVADRDGPVATACRAVAGRDDHVGAVVAQCLPGAGQRIAANPQPGTAVQSLERAQIVDERVGRDQRIVEQPEVGFITERNLAQPRLEFAGGREQAAAVNEQRLAGRSQAHLRPIANEQREAQLLLEPGHRV